MIRVILEDEVKRPTPEMLAALGAASLWGKIRMRSDNMVYRVRGEDKDVSVCSGTAALKMCERGWLEPRKWRGMFEFEITGLGREVERGVGEQKERRGANQGRCPSALAFIGRATRMMRELSPKRIGPA